MEENKEPFKMMNYLAARYLEECVPMNIFQSNHARFSASVRQSTDFTQLSKIVNNPIKNILILWVTHNFKIHGSGRYIPR